LGIDGGHELLRLAWNSLRTNIALIVFGEKLRHKITVDLEKIVQRVPVDVAHYCRSILAY